MMSMVSLPKRGGGLLHYRAFGLGIESDVPLPGFFPDCRAVRPHTRVWLASKPPWVDYALTLPRSPCRQRGVVHALGTGEAEFLHVAYEDGAVEFLISKAGDRVFGRMLPPLTHEDALIYVAGPILGMVLRRLGRPCLHASAVAWKDRAVMFVGPSGAGKSTTAAAALIRHGARMVTDDVAVVQRSDSTYLIEPGQARLRLWESSTQFVFSEEKALPRLMRNWDKRYLDASARFSLAAPVLERICFLGGLVPPSPSALVSPRDALVLLAANVYGTRLVSSANPASEFGTLSDLAQAVPAIVLPNDYGARRVDELLEALRENQKFGGLSFMPADDLVSPGI